MGKDRTRCPVCREDAASDQVSLGGYRLFFCPGCGLRFAWEAFAARVDYNLVYHSEEYQATQVQALFRPQAVQEFIRHPTYASFFRRVKPFRGAHLLDVGCGVGRFGQAAFFLGWKVTGIDISEEAVEWGRRFAQFEIKKASLEVVVESGERFDVVSAFEVLEHLADPVGFLALARRVIKPGGLIFCTVPNWDCREVQEATRPDWLPPIHLCFFPERALATAPRAAGFERVSTGVIWTDPWPAGLFPQARWFVRHLRRRPHSPLGLWTMARQLR